MIPDGSLKSGDLILIETRCFLVIFNFADCISERITYLCRFSLIWLNINILRMRGMVSTSVLLSGWRYVNVFFLFHVLHLVFFVVEVVVGGGGGGFVVLFLLFFFYFLFLLFLFLFLLLLLLLLLFFFFLFFLFFFFFILEIIAKKILNYWTVSLFNFLTVPLLIIHYFHNSFLNIL